MTYGVPTKMFNLQITQYTVNTFLEAAASTGAPIDIASMVAIYEERALSTIDLGYWIPGIVNAYGNKMVDMDFKILPYSRIEMNDDKIYASLNTAMNITSMDEPIL